MRRKCIVRALVCSVAIVSTMMLAGCDNKSASKKTEVKVKDEICLMSDDEQDELYEKLFDINNKVTIKIDMSDDEIKKIQEDYFEYDRMHAKSPIYRMADKVTFIIDDKEYVVEEVGVRMKGNTSRTDFYNMKEGTIYNLINLKMSFDETFDNKDYYGKDVKKWSSKKDKKARQKRRFAGLKTLEFKANKSEDKTFIRQYYSYEMFRENGVPAPRSNIAQLCTDDTNFGVFMINEPVDKKFIERNFAEEDQGGDLYKGAWTNSPADYTYVMTYGCSANEEGEKFNLDLKTNKSTSKNENLEKFIDVINKSGASKEELEEVLDKENWVNFCAVSYFTGNPDDLRNNYNNHYVYFSPKTGKAYFIPYDYDRCLGITKSWNPDASGMTESSPFSEKAEASGRKQNNPLYIKTLIYDKLFLDEYKVKLSEIAAGDWMKVEKFNSIFEIAKNNYDDCSKPDNKYQNIVKDNQVFTLDGEFIYGDDSTNMAVADYFEGIMRSYNLACK